MKKVMIMKRVYSYDMEYLHVISKKLQFIVQNTYEVQGYQLRLLQISIACPHQAIILE